MLSRMTARTLRRPSSSSSRSTTSSSSSSSSCRLFNHRTLTSKAPSVSTAAVVSQVFKPWPADKTPGKNGNKNGNTNGMFVTCYGDYRDEAWIEQHIGGPLYAHQATLPRLPVPSLHDTVQRFLPTATCLAQTAQERQALERKAAMFPTQAAVLQERLLQRAKEAASNQDPSSWLQHWWNTIAYLDYRDSVVINVSYFFHLADDASASSNTTTGSRAYSVSSGSRNNSTPMIRRAAALMTAACQVRRQVCSGTWPCESVGRGDAKKMLDSTAFKYMFHATRIPTHARDTVHLYDPARHHHVVVACRGYFFAVPLCDPVTGHALPLVVLETSLQDAVQQATLLEQQQDASMVANVVPKLGVLTAWNRDDWSAARTALLEAGGEPMQRALEMLESAALVICLDVDAAPVGRNECARHFLHTTINPNPNETTTGSSSSENRWWDKSIQLSVCANGKAGFIGEHCMMDGMPQVGLAHHLTRHTYDQCVLDEERNTSSSASSIATGTATPIFTPDLYPAMMQIQGMVTKARNDFCTLVNNNSLHVQSFQGYGSDLIKRAGYSPDAFVQMALQIATFRLWNGRQGGTYESTQVRPFLQGRTEVTRSVSEQSAALCRAFGLAPQRNEHVPEQRSKKLQLLRDAVNAHIKYIGLAAQGQGVDRHFLGLSMLVQPGEELPELYSDPTFQYSKRWRVSTSHLTHPRFDGWGFGQVYPDGVGVAYSIHARHCIFTITALKEHDNWTDKLSQLLEEALLEFQTLVEMDQPPEQQPKSKL